MNAPDDLYRLVERFDQNRDAYQSGKYNETQARVEFIDPLFELLGWDINNRGGAPEAYKDIVHEDAIKVGGAHKAPDYGFRVGGVRKFFVEAKKPSVNLRDDIGPAFQLRRYAWSAKLPVSILTDFEEFAVYDTRVTPDKKDAAATARLQIHSFDQYPDAWDDIAGVFSKEAVLGGSLDAYAEKAKGKRGTATVDAVFLKEIESWRETLARDLALRNPDLTQRELNYAVQITIDRIIFLRMTEDRGIEEYGRLQALLNGQHVYGRLRDLYRQADERYNSGLFHFQQEKGRGENHDTLTPKLTFGDTTLRGIIKSLYYPDSPYEFSVLPIEVLGQVYEQFLGKVIELSPNRSVKIEAKPEVRKAGGVYYTPKYIVDYIVEQTVGKLVEGKRPGPRGGVSKIRIVDPACGSGSFLIGAYEYLLDWHRDRYIEDGPEKHRNELYQGQGGQWHLTTSEKKRILLNNIYGVDIDPQAVEVTKLSLLLKVLEGESSESLVSQLRLFRERALPDLSNNIKCGNSLIGPDFYDTGQLSFLDPEEHYRINVFDWKTEFSEVTSAGGFDVVIGNPPYGIVFDDIGKSYLERNYPAFARNNDMYVAFTQKSVGLLKLRGLFGFIVPNTYLIGPYFDDLKQTIVEQTNVLQVVDFGTNLIFPKPNVFTSLLFLQRTMSPDPGFKSEFVYVNEAVSFPNFVTHHLIDRTQLQTFRWSPSNALLTRVLLSKAKLEDIAWVKDVGLNYWTRGRGKSRGGSIAERVLYAGEQEHPADRAYLKGRNIQRYSFAFGGHWLRHNYQDFLDPTVDTMRFSTNILDQPKILYRQTADSIIATIEETGLLVDKTVHVIVLRDEWKSRIDSRFLLGLLNSRLLSYIYRSLALEKGRAFAQVKVFQVKQLPICGLRTENASNDESQHDIIVGLVDQMLTLVRSAVIPKTSHDHTVLQRQIEATDRKIDQLVYELYGLTDEEISVVEGSM